MRIPRTVVAVLVGTGLALVAPAAALAGSPVPSTSVSPSSSASAGPSGSAGASASPSASRPRAAAEDLAVTSSFSTKIAYQGDHVTQTITVTQPTGFATTNATLRFGSTASPLKYDGYASALTCDADPPYDAMNCSLPAGDKTATVTVNWTVGELLTWPQEHDTWVAAASGDQKQRIDITLTLDLKGSSSPSASASASASVSPSASASPSESTGISAVPSSVTTSPVAAGGLPVTGTSLGVIAGSAVALLGGGGMLLVLARRRRDARAE